MVVLIPGEVTAGDAKYFVAGDRSGHIYILDIERNRNTEVFVGDAVAINNFYVFPTERIIYFSHYTNSERMQVSSLDMRDNTVGRLDWEQHGFAEYLMAVTVGKQKDRRLYFMTSRLPFFELHRPGGSFEAYLRATVFGYLDVRNGRWVICSREDYKERADEEYGLLERKKPSFANSKQVSSRWDRPEFHDRGNAKEFLRMLRERKAYEETSDAIYGHWRPGIYLLKTDSGVEVYDVRRGKHFMLCPRPPGSKGTRKSLDLEAMVAIEE
jgi:hypothetical protein